MTSNSSVDNFVASTVRLFLEKFGLTENLHAGKFCTLEMDFDFALEIEGKQLW
jgi:hypothetical protein